MCVWRRSPLTPIDNVAGLIGNKYVEGVTHVLVFNGLGFHGFLDLLLEAFFSDVWDCTSLEKLINGLEMVRSP